MNHITTANLSEFAFLNTDTLRLPVKAVCVCFHGYTDGTMYSGSPEEARILGAHGIAWVFPYYSVWAWMSPSSRLYNEQVLDAVYRKLDLPDSVPLISTGGSMGGLTALLYGIYGKRVPIACAANCPVTDLPLFYQRNPDVRRAIVSAHVEAELPMKAVLPAYSPVHQAKQLPDIPYYCVFGELDGAVDEEYVSAFEQAMTAARRRITVCRQPGMQHCDLASHRGAFDAYYDFIIRAAEKREEFLCR